MQQAHYSLEVRLTPPSEFMMKRFNLTGMNILALWRYGIQEVWTFGLVYNEWPKVIFDGTSTMTGWNFFT